MRSDPSPGQLQILVDMIQNSEKAKNFDPFAYVLAEKFSYEIVYFVVILGRQ